MATLITARTLKGFRDTLPADMAAQSQMLRTIEDTFVRHGFAPLDTPVLEYGEILTGKYGEEGDKLLYTFDDRGGRRVAMRYDLTVPLARVVAQHGGKLGTPLRRYQVGKVWRADKPQRGRFREFMQCDADICGSNTAMADAEVMVCGLGVLKALGVDDFRLHVNHRHLLFGMMGAFGLDDADPAKAEAMTTAAIRAIDKLDKVGADKVRAEIAAFEDAPQGAADIVDFILAAQHAADPLAAVESRIAATATPEQLAGIARTREVLTLVAAAGLGEHVVYDPAIARGLDYYTGVIYETRLTHPKVATMGAVMSGGRYDELIGMFSKQSVPAVGISLGLSRLLAALQELGLIDATGGQADVFVTVFSPDTAGTSLAVAQELRAAGVSVEVSMKVGKLGKQFAQADRRGCKIAVVIGPDEAAQGLVKTKVLATGAQTTSSRDKFAAEVWQSLAGNL